MATGGMRATPTGLRPASPAQPSHPEQPRRGTPIRLVAQPATKAGVRGRFPLTSALISTGIGALLMCTPGHRIGRLFNVWKDGGDSARR